MSLFSDQTKSPDTTKIGVSSGTGENPKWNFWLQKCHFVCTLWKHNYTIIIVFSAKHSFAEIKECKLKKQKFTKNRDCLLIRKNNFGILFLFWVVLFFVFCIFVLLFCTKAKKGYIFSCFRVFFVPPKSHFSYFVFLSFSFCLPFQNIFSLFVVHHFSGFC